jgi:hypothetical protein
MSSDFWLEQIPLWGICAATIVIALLSFEAGFQVGRHRSHSPEHESETPISAMVAAMLGLLAFMLAFTFGMAESRFDARRQAILDEANAIGTTYLRAELIPEPHRTNVRKLLHEYLDVRVKGIQTLNIEQTIVRSEELQSQLWSEAVAVGSKNPNSIVGGLFTQSLNEMIDLHTKRVFAGLQSQIPGIIWVILYCIAIFTITAIGYYFGLNGKRSVFILSLLVLIFSSVMMLIADLDRPQHGFIKTSQKSLVDLLNKMGTQPP